jgi:DNA-binding response OmpR family regulator
MNSALQLQPSLVDQPSAIHHLPLLFVDSESASSNFIQGLQLRFDVSVAATEEQALRLLKPTPTLVVTELDLPEGDGVAVCRAAKAISRHPPMILVTTAAVERVPGVLAAGCDAVLLKPFPPNLLYARLGRLTRERDASRTQRTVAHLAHGLRPILLGTNRLWVDAHCPHCQHEGIISFDHASHRRMWYACLACEHVWMAARLED